MLRGAAGHGRALRASAALSRALRAARGGAPPPDRGDGLMGGLRILITNNSLAMRAGSELYVRDLATALLARGLTPIAYSTELGDVARELRAPRPPPCAAHARARLQQRRERAHPRRRAAGGLRPGGHRARRGRPRRG